MGAYLARPLPDGKGRVTQKFGEHPDWYKPFGLAGHNGMDYGVAEGTPVLAAHSGIIKTGIDQRGYGRWVKVISKTRQTLYAHLLEFGVKDGDRVTVGWEIGKSGGATGITGNSTGAHLHFGVKWLVGRNPAYGDYVDPLPFRQREINHQEG